MSSPPPLVVPPLAARRFVRRALGLDTPHPDLAAALAHHGYIQIDPINVCGRMHDLILRNRVARYREGDLMRHVHGNGAPLAAEQRVALEHHVPGTGILVAFPLEAWPHLLGAMRQWSLGRGAWAGRLTPREETLAKHLLAEIAARGPLGSEDFDDPRRARRAWGASKLVKATLQKMFFHGRVLIAHRANNRRRYDLPERVLPGAVLAQREPSATETARWRVSLKLRQRRLVLLTRDELRIVEDRVQAVAIEGCPTLYCLREDVPVLEACESEGRSLLAGDCWDRDRPRSQLPHSTEDGRGPAQTVRRPAGSCSMPREVAPIPRLLAPLDPLIYDRRVTSALWDFDYTWEAYTPPRKRVRGYYALPVLIGTEIVGHVDPKADRAEGKLRVISRRIRRGRAVAPALRELAKWLGLK